MDITTLLIVAIIVIFVGKSLKKEKCETNSEQTQNEDVAETTSLCDNSFLAGLRKIIVKIITIVVNIFLAIFKFVSTLPIIGTIVKEVKENLTQDSQKSEEEDTTDK